MINVYSDVWFDNVIFMPKIMSLKWLDFKKTIVFIDTKSVPQKIFYI